MAIYFGQRLINSTSSNYIKSGDNISKLTNDAGYLVESNLADYAKTADIENDYATKTEIEGKISSGSLGTINGQSIEDGNNISIDFTLIKIAAELPVQPSTNEDKNKIWLIPAANALEKNLYTEYIYNSESNAWEKLGEYKTDVDLNGYLTEEDASKTYLTQASAEDTYVPYAELDTKLAELEYAKKSDIPDNVSDLTNDSHFITSSDNTVTNVVYISNTDYASLGSNASATTLYIVYDDASA